MAKTSWADIVKELKELRGELNEQHFWIDISYKLYRNLKKYTAHRKDLNLPAISTYWGYEIYQHFLLNNLELKEKAVFFNVDYYSILNLEDFKSEAEALGRTIYIVDLITDSTDVKEGEDFEEWYMADSSFRESMKDIWNDELLEVWQDEDLLVTRKRKNIDFENYYKSENYILMLKVADTDINTIVFFLLGTYADYMDNP